MSCPVSPSHCCVQTWTKQDPAIHFLDLTKKKNTQRARDSPHCSAFSVNRYQTPRVQYAKPPPRYPPRSLQALPSLHTTLPLLPPQSPHTSPTTAPTASNHLLRHSIPAHTPRAHNATKMAMDMPRLPHRLPARRNATLSRRRPPLLRRDQHHHDLAQRRSRKADKAAQSVCKLIRLPELEDVGTVATLLLEPPFT